MNLFRLTFPLLLLSAGDPVFALGGSPKSTIICTLATPRAKGHSATVLADGTVLVAGGLVTGSRIRATAEAEIIDPVAGRVRAVGRMADPRAWHTATLLPEGKVLITGGAPRNASVIALASAEIFDPATGTFTPTRGPMGTARHTHTATLLQDGTVLITGGDGAHPDQVESSSELFDPRTETFQPLAARMTAPRTQHTATLLESGQVLIAGGTNWTAGPCPTVEVYDPSTRAFGKLDALPAVGAQGAGAMRLRSGRVLFVGPKGADLYDPPSGTFLETSSPIHHRRGCALAFLPGGGAALIGGEPYPSAPSSAALKSVEVFQESPGRFEEGEPLPEARLGSLAVTLKDGRIMVIGGTNGSHLPAGKVEIIPAPES